MRLFARPEHSLDVRALLVLLILSLSAFAASKTPAPPRSDATVEADIRARLGRSKISADGFQVRVQGGIATLTGRTDVIQHKGVATRLAKSGGAARVNNQIQISQAAREKAAARLAEARQTSRPAKPAGKHAAAAAPTPKAAGSQPVAAAVTKAPAAPPTAAVLAPPPVRRAVIKH